MLLSYGSDLKMTVGNPEFSEEFMFYDFYLRNFSVIFINALLVPH